MDDHLNVDLLVIGGGMTGLTAAASAARRGLEVLLVEKAPQLGGSAAMSEGYMWTAPDLSALQWEDPECDVELATVLADHFVESMEWVKSLGVELSEKITGIYGFGHGWQTDIGKYLDRCRSALESSAGWVSAGVQVQELVRDGGRVTGAKALDSDGGEVVIEAAWTLLATGGFQANPDLRRRFIGPAGEGLVLRSNPYSTGDGLMLGLAAGAVAGGGQGFYGHLMARPLDDLQPNDYLNFSQLHSGYCLVVNKHGERFTDESMGDHVNNQRTLSQPGSTALIIGDEYVRRTHVMSAYIKGMDVLDKLVLAGRTGANYATAATIGELADQVSAWGYSGPGVEQTVSAYNEVVESDPQSLSPPSERYSRPLDSPPYFALEVQPAITFPYAGLATNGDAEVLGESAAIPGLLAGGVDVGGVYKRGYAGGLARGLVSGIRAALTAAGEPSWRPAVGDRA